MLLVFFKVFVSIVNWRAYLTRGMLRIQVRIHILMTTHEWRKTVLYFADDEWETAVRGRYPHKNAWVTYYKVLLPDAWHDRCLDGRIACPMAHSFLIL